MLQPPNMHARIFTVSNTVPPFIVINRVSSPSLEATPPSALDHTTRGNVSIKTPLILHCNPLLQPPQHACKHFYGFQHSSTFHCHQPDSHPEFRSHTPFFSPSHYKRERFYKTPLILHCNPMLQPPQHASKHF